MKKLLLIITLMICPGRDGISQTFESNNLGASIGATFALGNRFDRLGISLRGFYSGDFFQLNPGVSAYYNFRNLGPNEKYWEMVPSLGAVISFGRKDSSENPFINVVSNQTQRKNSIGYAYNFYYNNKKTTQGTGTVSIQFSGFQLVIENDYLAFSLKDEFRTGAFLLQYQYRDFQVGINATLWTGVKGRRIDDPDFPSRSGYLDMSNSLYGNHSHGLLSLQVQYAAPYGQIVQMNAGVDAEEVRNILQNKMMHDLAFTPEKWGLSNNAHIPMIDANGNSFLYQPDQVIRPVKPYYNVFLNPSLFY